MFIVVSYDISDDRRRAKLCRKLKSFGTWVQYSVFECLLDTKGFERMKEAVKGIIKKGEDHVRYYPLCETCEKRIQAIGGIVTQPIRTLVV